MAERLPLPAVLSRPISALTGAYARAGARTDTAPSLAMWSVLLRALSDQGNSEEELQRLTAVSRRALRAILTSGKREGWVSVESGGDKLVRLTAAGKAVQRAWPGVIAAAEDDWHSLVGKGPSERARRATAAIVSQFELEWPWHPVSYGRADGSVTGGSYRPAQEGPPRIPAHGQDWTPVIRESSDGVAQLRIEAVLAQALSAFSSDYEQHRVGPISTSMALRRALDEWVPIDAFPVEAGVTGGGKSGLERHHLVELKVDPSLVLSKGQKGNLVRPSVIGRTVRDSYGPVTARVEADWHRRYGVDHLEGLRLALEDLDAKLPSDLPDYVIVRHVRR